MDSSTSLTAPLPEPPAPAPPAPDLSDPALYLNRELSWLAFNQRVLDQAYDQQHPLLERVKFLAIAGNNLDEFCMVRFANLLRQHRMGVRTISPDGLNPEQQVALVRGRVNALLSALSACWEAGLRPLLAKQGIGFLEPDAFSPAVQRFLMQHFSASICPVLTPLAVDPGHPFPYVSNRSKSLALVVQHQGRTKFARVKVPDALPRFVAIPPEVVQRPGLWFAFLEDVIRLNLPELFPGVQITSAHLFRVIRDTDIVVQEEGIEDLLESVGRSLKQVRHGALALLEVESAMPERVLDVLIENFEAREDVVVRTTARMGLADWMSLTKLQRPELKDPPFSPRMIWRSSETELPFDEIKYEDSIVHHPFDSFTTVETFLTAAVRDPLVAAIKMTLYRIGSNSPLVDLLIEAAERGKQVAVLVELKARFDERSNIGWATRLEEAGVHVVYGLLNLKTHCKLCLVVRQAGDGIQRYAHVGTGNYDRATAHVYTDLGLFTANARIVSDLSELFNYLTGYSNQTRYRELIVAPANLRGRLVELIEREADHARAGRPAQIVVKCNAVTDPRLIRAFYGASRAGVSMDMIVRGICCLRPGVPGVSDRIRVRSIVGRFLEHSRMYYFRNGGAEELFIGSADLMERNLDRRVEALCPILDPDIRKYLREVVLDAYLRDNTRAFELEADGTYRRIQPEDSAPLFSAQQFLVDWSTVNDPGRDLI